MHEATEGHAEVTSNTRGLIDILEIRDSVASMLEGGKETFLQRKGRYGFDQ